MESVALTIFLLTYVTQIQYLEAWKGLPSHPAYQPNPNWSVDHFRATNRRPFYEAVVLHHVHYVHPGPGSDYTQHRHGHAELRQWRRPAAAAANSRW